MSTRRRLQLLSLFTALILGACATDGAAEAPATPEVPALDTPAWAVDEVSAAADADRLALVLAEAVGQKSGAPIVSKSQVTQEINDCAADPCPTVMREAFTQAPVVIGANVAAAGAGFLATGTARQGAKVVARASATGRSADEAVRDVGAQLGEALRLMFVNGEL